MGMQYKWGLTLSGGGAKGFFEAGVMKRLFEMGFQPEIISGTSVGSLVGALIADGRTPDDMLEVFGNLSVAEFIEPKLPKEYLVDSKPVRKLMEKLLRAKTFEELQIPLRVVATCLETGEGVVFDKGPLLDALIASCSIPIVFPPVVINGQHYVDGGTVKNLPSSVIRNDCERLLAISVHPSSKGKYEKKMRYIATHCLEYLFNANTVPDKALADILIEDPIMKSYSAYDLKDSHEMFRLGYLSSYIPKTIPIQ